MEKVKRWGIYQRRPQASAPQEKTQEVDQNRHEWGKNASEVKIIKLISPLEKNDHGVLLAAKEVTVVT